MPKGKKTRRVELTGAWDPVNQTWKFDDPAMELDKRITVKHKPQSAAQRQAKHRKYYKLEREAKIAALSAEWDSDSPVPDDEVLNILRSASGRGLRNIHVIETVFELGKIAAELNKITPNRFYWTNGLIQTQKSIQAKAPQPLEPISDEQAPWEIICQRDLFALYDYSISWRKIDWPLDSFEEFKNLVSPSGIDCDFTNFIERKGQQITFDEFRKLRYFSKSDCLWFSRWVHGKDFWPEPHGEWADFFVKKIPCLPMDYTMEDFKNFFKNQNDEGVKKRLLIASRNSYKSSYQLMDCLTWILCAPDARLLEMTAVKNLSKGFVKTFRDFWTIYDSRNPSLFAALFPEMMIYAEDKSDSSNFISPMAHLGLSQPQMASSSADSSQTGTRCDCLYFDDFGDEVNQATPELREKLVDKFELVCKLVEPHGHTFVIGTPQAAEGDLLQVILERSEKAHHAYWKYRIDPCWIIKPDAALKPLNELVEDDIQSLLFPSRLTFKFLKSELENGSLKGFRRQNMCEWVEDDGEANLRTNFSEDVLRANIISPSGLPETGDIVLTADVAWTTNRWSDPSAIAVTKHYFNAGRLPSMCLLDAESDRWPASLFGEKVVLKTKQYKPRIVIIEKGPNKEAIEAAIHDACRKYGEKYPPIFWLPPSNQKQAKVVRMKGLEALVSSTPSRLTFLAGPHIDLIFRQLMFINEGRKSNSAKKRDDAADALSIGQIAMPKSEADPSDIEAAKQLREEQRQREEQQAMHSMIFEGAQNWHVSRGSEWGKTSTEQTSAEPESTGRGLFGIPGLRYNNYTTHQPQPPSKFAGFGDLRKKN